MFFVDDDESILSYGSGSIRSSARSPRKRVKLWHPSQDNVSPFLNETTERSMRRKLNSTNAMDNSTQTPEKNDPRRLPSTPPAQEEANGHNENSENEPNLSTLSKKSDDMAETEATPKKVRALNLDEISPPTVGNVELIEPQPSTSAGTRSNVNYEKPAKSKRVPSLDSTSSNEEYQSGRNKFLNQTNQSLESSNDERLNEDHVFVRPRNCIENTSSYKLKENRVKGMANAKRFRFLENSTDHSLRSNYSKGKKSTKNAHVNAESPWNRADLTGNEDITWTPSNFKRASKRSSSSSDEETNANKTKSKKATSENGNSFSSDGSSRSNQQRYYQREEEIKILDFIIQHRAFSQVKGNTLWKVMEATQVLPDRTPQSMKERFRRYILPKLDKYEHLSENDIENFRHPPTEDGNVSEAAAGNPETSTSKANTKQNTLGPAESGIPHVDEIESRKEDDNVSVISHRTTTSSIMSGSKQSRNYNKQEEIAILDFITTNRRYSEVNGNTLWQLMETKTIVANRSWQSMKERFRRHIAPNLNRFNNLTPKDINQFNKYLSSISKQIRKKSK